MSRTTIEKLTDILRDVFVDDTIVIDNSTTAEDVEGWDSLSHVRLIMAVERGFKVTLPPGDVMDLMTVGDLVALIERRLAA